MEVLEPKGPHLPDREHLSAWAKDQLLIASDIVDNPGGGLLFATQTMGQVRSALLRERGDAAAREIDRLLYDAEDAAVRRKFGRARELIAGAAANL